MTSAQYADQSDDMKMETKGKTTAWEKHPPQSVDDDMVQDQPRKIDARHPTTNRHHLNVTKDGLKDSTLMMIVPFKISECRHTPDLDVDDAQAEALGLKRYKVHISHRFKKRELVRMSIKSRRRRRAWIVREGIRDMSAYL